MSAFERYLLQLPRHEAVQHLLECLTAPGSHQAWELLEKFHGEWKCKPSELTGLLNRTLDALELETKE